MAANLTGVLSRCCKARLLICKLSNHRLIHCTRRLATPANLQKILFTSRASVRPASPSDYEGDDNAAIETDPFMQEHIENYEKGKRWLARMMGGDPEVFTQKDIDDAIAYLLPSSLWAKDARPTMRHPFEIFPKRKQDVVDKAGRPYDAAFFTGRPNYFDLTFAIWEVMESMSKANTPLGVTVASNEEGIGNGIATEDVQQPKVQGLLQWVTKLQLEAKLSERLSEKQYQEVLFRLKKLAAHQHSNLAREFLADYQTPVETPGKADLMEVELHDGVARAIGYRKTAVADVFLRKGCGKYTVNDLDIAEFFSTQNDIEQLMFPFVVVGELSAFDVEAYVTGGGTSGKSGAIRLAVSKAIAALCPHHFEALDKAGLLIRDYRQVERKKPGRRKARRQFQWVKR